MLETNGFKAEVTLSLSTGFFVFMLALTETFTLTEVFSKDNIREHPNYQEQTSHL